MEVTSFVVSSRGQSLLDGDYATYRAQLSGKLLNTRKKLGIATKNRGKYHPKGWASAEQIAEKREYLQLQILTAERAWAHAMTMKAAHSADTKGITGKTRSHIVSRLEKAAKTAEELARTLQDGASGAGSTDVLEARAYASLLRGAALFEGRNWESCVKNFSVARIIYSALSTSAAGETYKDILSETIDPSIRYAAYQLGIPRTEPVPTIARKAFPHADDDLVDRLKQLNPEVLKHGDPDAKQGLSGPEGAPSTLTWRNRQVKIEDAAISVAWANVGAERSRLTEKLSSSPDLDPKEMAAAYDEILLASQDAVDATKQAIDELKAEGVPASDKRMESLQITRTAVNYEAISWRIGRNRILTGRDDGAPLTSSTSSRKRRARKEPVAAKQKDETPGRLVARLKEKVVLYDGTLQSIESITKLPGIPNDQELSSRLQATSDYFIALKSLAIARSHYIAGHAVNSLALINFSLSKCQEALAILSEVDGGPELSPRDVTVTKEDVRSLHELLSRELQRSRALVDISNVKTPTSTSSSSAKPLVERLAEYPESGINLENIVSYPPRAEPVPIKPIFLDVAWNFIDYPDKREKSGQKTAGQIASKVSEEEAKPQKRGWFGFGR